MCHVNSFEKPRTFRFKCVSEGSSWSLSNHSEKPPQQTAPLLTSQQWLATMCEKLLQCLCREEKYEHSIFSHRDTAEHKPLKWFFCWPFTTSDVRLPEQVGNPVNVGVTSSVNSHSAMIVGHLHDLSLIMFLRHVWHVTANYLSVKDTSKHSSLYVMALVQFYFIKLLQCKTEVKQFFWGLNAPQFSSDLPATEKWLSKRPFTIIQSQFSCATHHFFFCFCFEIITKCVKYSFFLDLSKYVQTCSKKYKA